MTYHGLEFRPVTPPKRHRRRWLLLTGAVALAGGGFARFLRTTPPAPVDSVAAAPFAATPEAVTTPDTPIIETLELPTPLPTPAPIPTAIPAALPTASPEPTIAPQPSQTAVPAPAADTDVRAVPTVLRTTAIAKELDWFDIGTSVEGRPIRAIRIGTGPLHLAIMGAIHGGWEKNTMTLVQQTYEHFRDNSTEIPQPLSVYFVQATNPDGIALGTDSDSAWNARGVDLNRNFASYNWSRDTFGLVGGRYGPSGTKKNGGGPHPFSEPETQSIKSFIENKSIGVVLSYHSGIVSVAAKDGGGGIGEPLAEEVADITGYGYIAKWTLYKLTGQFMDWLDEQGVKGVEIELPTRTTLDWAKNLKSMRAVMHTMAEG